MGSGLGRHQRTILEALERDPDVLVIDLARKIYGVGSFTSAQYGNLTQALRTLETRGLVKCYTRMVRNHWHPSHIDPLPAVRLVSQNASQEAL